LKGGVYPLNNNIRKKTSYKIGDVVWATVEREGSNGNRKYVGRHLYVIISNNKFNYFSDVVEAFPITSKRWGKPSPSHVNYIAGEIAGTTADSTVMIENRDTLTQNEIEECVGHLTEDQLLKIAYAMAFQNPITIMAYNKGVQNTSQFKDIVAFC
jgi:mRNA-degrading endonuclease toxin of MazEF toxin-antitoxin module